MPSEQLVQIEISLRELKTCFLNEVAFGDLMIVEKESFFKSPNWCVASLSKQQGTNKPSQVITLPDHIRQHELSILYLRRYVPFASIL